MTTNKKERKLKQIAPRIERKNFTHKCDYDERIFFSGGSIDNLRYRGEPVLVENKIKSVFQRVVWLTVSIAERIPSSVVTISIVLMTRIASICPPTYV